MFLLNNSIKIVQMLKFTSINKENPNKIDSKVRSKNFDEIYANYAKKKAEEQT